MLLSRSRINRTLVSPLGKYAVQTKKFPLDESKNSVNPDKHYEI